MDQVRFGAALLPSGLCGVGGVASIRFNVASARATVSFVENESESSWGDCAMPTPITRAPKKGDEFGAYWPTKRLEKAYHLALGVFLDTYGRFETALALYVTRFAAQAFGNETKRSIALARALVVGQRTADLTDKLKRLMRVSGASDERQQETKAALDQLSLIHKMRDRLAHFGGAPEFHEGQWMVRTTNELSAKESDKVEEVFFRIEDLEDMTADLVTIKVGLRHALFPSLAARKDAQQPWRHKSSRLKVRGPQSAPTTQK